MSVVPIPLFVDWTREDREAKGLRKLLAREAAPPPVPDTVLEAVAHEPLLLLAGACGCGKTTSLRALAQRIVDRSDRPVVRNDAGEVAIERWDGPDLRPVLLTAEAPTTLAALWTNVPDDGPVLLMIDQAERLGAAGPAFLGEAADLAQARPGLRIVVAVDADAGRAWSVPSAWTRRRIVGLIDAQRLALRDAVRAEARVDDWATALPEVREHAGWFTLALACEMPMPATAGEVVDRWIAEASRRTEQPAAALAALGADAFERAIEIRDDALACLRNRFVQRQLAARRLATQPAEVARSRLADDPLRWSPVVEIAGRSLAARPGRGIDAYVSRLLDGDAVAVAAAIVSALPPERIGDAVHAAIRDRVARLVDRGDGPAATRRNLGRVLALEGDPRDLEALVAIAAGEFSMGSGSHPNSAPVHVVALPAYRIGRYPVVNRHYREFVETTGRPWRSQDGRDAERANAPAVELTWHDARAYCDWLTARWRASGRIGAHEHARLPTEAEWERAARGVRVADGLVFPWPGDWQPDCANAEDAGFNDTCTVGLFPRGRSPEGCEDMAGQVWEWVSTLWGTDMATPSFRYPYVDDGREAATAAPDVRRVLRGACFLSPREKANCTYRGSLEPDGFWRGNGFRVAVGPA